MKKIKRLRYWRLHVPSALFVAQLRRRTKDPRLSAGGILHVAAAADECTKLPTLPSSWAAFVSSSPLIYRTLSSVAL